MKDRIKNMLLLVASFIILILFLKGCESQPVKEKYVQKIDSVITHKTDTIWAKDTTYVLRFKPKQVDSIYIHDSVYADCDYLRFYHDSISDTNLVANIDYIVKGKIIGSGMTYKLKIPIKIIDTTTVRINTVKTPKIALYGGLQGSNKTFGPFVDLNLPKYNFGVGYDIINKSPEVKVGIKLFQK